MSADDAAVTTIRKQAEADGLLGKSLYVENGSVMALPYADRAVDLLVISNLRNKDLTPALLSEIFRVLGPQRGTALVGRDKESGAGPSRRALKKWTSDLPLATVISDDTGIWAVLRTARPANMDSWTHRNHGAENTQVSADASFQAPFLTQWWGLPRQEGFWGTTVVSCNGRMFSIRGSRHAGSQVSLTARALNNGIVLWQKKLILADAKVPHGGYIPGRSCVAATDDSLLLVISNNVMRVDAETGMDRSRIAGPKAGGQVKWIGCSGNLLAMLAGDPDKVTSISYQSVSANPIGRSLAVYDLEKNQMVWQDTVAGDVDEKLLALRDNKLYLLVQGTGLVCRDLKTGAQLWVNPDADLQVAFNTPPLSAIREFLVSLPVLSAYDDVLLFRAKWVKDTYAFSRLDGSLLWKKPTVGGSYRGLTACAVDDLWVGAGQPTDLKTGITTNGPRFVSSGCGPTTCTPGYLITCFGMVSDIKSNKLIRGEDTLSIWKTVRSYGKIILRAPAVTIRRPVSAPAAVWRWERERCGCQRASMT